jgi:lipopolysaccharide transport system permease protein
METTWFRNRLKKSNTSGHWTRIIRSNPGKLELKLPELWQQRDLIYLLVKRDFVVKYKQTILGPAWHLIQPLFVTIIFTIVFGRIARISTENTPPFLFYMAGTILWTYFSAVLLSTSNTFIHNSSIFGKVYFPRLIVPIAKSLSNVITFSIQFFFFLCFVAYFDVKGVEIHPNAWVLATPVLLLMLAVLALGLGAIICSMTTRYRDLIVLVGFGVQLFMYATPVIYPMSAVPEAYRPWVLANPVTPIVELFRHAFLGTSPVDMKILTYSFVVITCIGILGILSFNRVERHFMDTI